MKSRLQNISGLFAITATIAISAWSIADEAQDSDDQYRRILQKSILTKSGDVEVLVREHLYPPAWKAPTHFHDGDLFIYVVEGEFEVVTEEGGLTVFGPGEALRMAAETVMDARNASDTGMLKLVIFQVGSPGGPFLVPVD